MNTRETLQPLLDLNIEKIRKILEEEFIPVLRDWSHTNRQSKQCVEIQEKLTEATVRVFQLKQFADE